VLEDNTSSPAQAAQWLAYEDLTSEMSETIRSRFALATLLQYQWERIDTLLECDQSVIISCLLMARVDCIDKENTIGLVQSLNLSAKWGLWENYRQRWSVTVGHRSLDLSRATRSMEPICHRSRIYGITSTLGRTNSLRVSHFISCHVLPIST
jgi:hypothetical protein